MNETATSADLQPTLTGETLTLMPLAAADFEAVYAAAADPAIWEQHPEPTRHQREAFQRFFDGAMASRGAFKVIENATGEVVGSSRYYDWDPEKREIAIGFTFLVRRLWGGAANREMKRLMLDHAFRFADVVWFHVGQHNWRSRKAMEKIGGVAIREEERVAPDGVVHVILWYRIDAAAWRSTGAGPRGAPTRNERAATAEVDVAGRHDPAA